MFAPVRRAVTSAHMPAFASITPASSMPVSFVVWTLKPAIVHDQPAPRGTAWIMPENLTSELSPGPALVAAAGGEYHQAEDEQQGQIMFASSFLFTRIVACIYYTPRDRGWLR